MDRELTKIIARLEELKARANELGNEQQTFVANIKAAEDILEVARKEVENVKHQRSISGELPSVQEQ